MIYLDTCVIIAFIDELDPMHECACTLLGDLKDKRVANRLTLVELASVYSRAGIENSLALAIHSLERVNAEIVELDFDDVLMHALKLAPMVKLKTLNLLHVAACILMGAKTIATFDKEIKSRSDVLSTLGLKVIP